MENKPRLVIIKPRPPMEEPDISFLMKAQAQFVRAYQIPVNKTTQELYIKLTEEEHEEWVEEFYSTESKNFNELKELADVLYVVSGLYYQLEYTYSKATRYRKPKDETWDFVISMLVEEISIGNTSKKILLNLIYALFAYAEECDWDLAEAYIRVHRSNMSKLGTDGKPVRREDGKVLKGPNYKPPFLEDLTNGS